MEASGSAPFKGCSEQSGDRCSCTVESPATRSTMRAKKQIRRSAGTAVGGSIRTRPLVGPEMPTVGLPLRHWNGPHYSLGNNGHLPSNLPTRSGHDAAVRGRYGDGEPTLSNSQAKRASLPSARIRMTHCGGWCRRKTQASYKYMRHPPRWGAHAISVRRPGRPLRRKPAQISGRTST